MSNSDVLNDNVNLIRQVHRLTEQRQELLEVLEALRLREIREHGGTGRAWIQANAVITKVREQS